MNDGHLELCASDEWRDELRDVIIPYALSDADLGDDVLEVGSGPGRTTELLVDRFSHLTAVEVDQALADALRARLGGATLDVVHADATDMPFDDDRFSGAVSFTMLHHVPTVEMQDQLFAEVARVVRPGGRFVASDSMASDDLAAFHLDDVYNPVDPRRVERSHDSTPMEDCDAICDPCQLVEMVAREEDGTAIPDK